MGIDREGFSFYLDAAETKSFPICSLFVSLLLWERKGRCFLARYFLAGAKHKGYVRAPDILNKGENQFQAQPRLTAKTGNQVKKRGGLVPTSLQKSRILETPSRDYSDLYPSS